MSFSECCTFLVVLWCDPYIPAPICASRLLRQAWCQLSTTGCDSASYEWAKGCSCSWHGRSFMVHLDQPAKWWFFSGSWVLLRNKIEDWENKRGPKIKDCGDCRILPHFGPLGQQEKVWFSGIDQWSCWVINYPLRGENVEKIEPVCMLICLEP